MENSAVIHDVTSSLPQIISIDSQQQKETILRLYDPDCKLQNPYLAIHGRDEIVKSYATLATNNTKLAVNVESVTFDDKQLVCMADVHQTLWPKALGGMIAVKLHHIFKLQLETSDDGLLRVVEHQEIVVAEDMLAQMPLVGNYYQSSLRNAIGQLSLFGAAILDYTGILDLIPAAVQTTKGTASAFKQTAGSLANATKTITNKAIHTGGVVLKATGAQPIVDSMLSKATEFAKYGLALVIEEGYDPVRCYSYVCRPGRQCYVPTCPRSRRYEYLSRKAIHDIVKGAYVGASKRAGL